jgi:hypothetical protein
MRFDKHFILDPDELTLGIQGTNEVFVFPAVAGLLSGTPAFFGQEALDQAGKMHAYTLVRPLSANMVKAHGAQFLHWALHQAGAFEGLLAPSVTMLTSKDWHEASFLQYRDALMQAGVRKIRFQSRMERQQDGFVILAYESFTEMAFLSKGKPLGWMYIPFGKVQVLEGMEHILTKRTQVLAYPEEIREVYALAQAAMFAQDNRMIQACGMNRYGKPQIVQLPAGAYWPAMAEVIEQVVLWADSCLQALPVSYRQRAARQGIRLSGPWAQAYGLAPSLEQRLGYEAEVSNDPI